MIRVDIEDNLIIGASNEDRVWYNDSRQLHREGGPAIEKKTGDRFWYRCGELHREDGPAIEYANGDRSWYRFGERHREDGPAAEYANGYRAWYIHDRLHREDGLSMKLAEGSRKWYLDGRRVTQNDIIELHRPSIEKVTGFLCISNDSHIWYKKFPLAGIVLQYCADIVM